MIYLREKANPNYWMTFNWIDHITPLDFHVYDFKIDDQVYTNYSPEFQYNVERELTWQRMKA